MKTIPLDVGRPSIPQRYLCRQPSHIGRSASYSVTKLSIYLESSKQIPNFVANLHRHADGYDKMCQL